MGIWCRCFRGHRWDNTTQKSPFCDLDNMKFQYSFTKVYLGGEGKVTSLDKGIKFFMSFSVRDGILVKIKRMQPYSVLFDYIDGVYYINDEADIEYEQLVTALSRLKNKASNSPYMKVYQQLELIMYDFIVKYFY